MNSNQDLLAHLETDFDFEIFEKIQDEVVVFEIIHDILDNVADLRIAYVNNVTLNNLKKDLNESIGQTISEFYDEDISKQYVNAATDILSSGEGKKFDTYFKITDKYYSISAFSPDNKIIVTIGSDITEAKKAFNKSKRILENIGEIYFELDNEWHFNNANSRIKTVFGQEKDELIGKNIWDEFEELKDTEYYYKFHEAKNKNIKVIFKAKSLKADEWHKIWVYPNQDGLEIYLQDINHKIVLEKELKDKEIKFKTLFEENNDAVIIADIETGKYIDVNRKAQELTGYSKNELLSMGTGEIASNDLKEMAIKELRELSSEGNIKIETEIQTKDKLLIPIEISTSIIETGTKIYSFSILRDISSIKKVIEESQELQEKKSRYMDELDASNEKLQSTLEEIHKSNDELRKKEEQLSDLEQELQEKEAQYRSLAENLPSVLMRYDSDLRVIYIVPSAEHMTDISIDKYIGKTNKEVGIPEEICNLWESAIKKVFESGKAQEIQFEFPAVNNNYPKSFHLKFVPEFAIDGTTVQYVLGISTDITKVEKAEKENQELIGEVKQLKDDLEVSKDTLKFTTKELQTANEEISKGKEILIDVNNTLHKSEKESLKLLVEIEAIYNSAPIGLCTLDPDLRFIRVNKRLAEISGIPAEDHIGKTIHEIVPDIAEQAEDISKFIIKNGLPLLDFEFSINQDNALRTWTAQWVPLKDIDGKVTGINVSIIETTKLKNIEMKLKESEENEDKLIEQISEYEDKYNALLDSYSTLNEIIEGAGDLIAACNTDYDFIAFNSAYKEISQKLLGRKAELGMNIKDLYLDSPETHLEALQLWEKALNGEQFKVEMVFEINSQNIFYEITYYPLKDKYGNLIGASHIARNITERKKEEDRLKKQVEDLKVLKEEMERFADEAPHELQEYPEDITSSKEQQEKQYEDKSDEHADKPSEHEIEVNNNVETDNSIKHSHVATKEDKFNSIYTNSMLDHVIDNLKIQIEKYNGKINHDSLPNVRGDAGQLQIVFGNLISNAIKFRKPEEPPKIHISARKDIQNNEVVFQVTDNGTGIREQYRGAGMELSLIREIIDDHGGRIWTESSPDNGSTFNFTLPIN